GNTIKNNIVKNCANAGIGLAYGTKDNTVEGNTLDGNTYANIDLWMAGAGNIITDNTCKNAVNFYGISIKETSNTTIQNNNLTLNDIGVYIYSGTSENNEVHYNNIYGNTGYGAKNDDATSTLDTEKNYWGAVNPNFDNIISGSVDYFPWSTNEECTDFTNDDLITIVVDNGWTGYSNYQEVEVGGTNYYYNHNAFSTIQGGIDAVAESGTVNVAAGTYEEEITIDKSLTLRGATYNINKNDYNIPVDYAWDDSVESIIQPPEGFEDYDVVTIDDADDVTVEGFIIQALQRSSSGSRMLVHVYVDDENMENLNIINNVIGPNTNTESQDGSKGRMNIDLDINPYDASMGLTNSLISGNKIFGSEGNGNALFIWASYYAYGATGPSPMTGTIIEDNEICCGHRSGIETAGGFTGLTIRNNKIHNFSGLPEDDPDKLKYGHGILLIRGSGDKLADASSAYGPEDLTIENNEIYNNEKSGIYMGPINKDYTITGNDIYDNGWDGIMLDMDGQYWNPTFEPEPIAFQHAVYDGSENVVANENKIYNNGQKGVNVMGTPTNEFEFDAENNYWGTADGPGGEGSGTGDAVSGNVDYPPWYIDSAMTMLLDHNLQENQTLADNASLTVDENITDIVVPIGSPIQEINVPSTVTEDKEVSLDLSLLLNSSKDVSLINNLTLKREGTVANYTAAIPEGTIITGDSNWSGSIILPTVKNNANYTAPSGLVDVVIDIGSGSEINFSKAVKIIIGGRAGKKAAWSRGTTLTEITTVCDNVTNPTNIYPDKAPRECYIDDGSDLVIWTYHFTKFAAYTPASTTPPTGGGGGGGGRSRIVTPVVPVPEEEETAPEEEVKETPKEEAVTETTPEETPSDSAEATEHPKRRGFGEITGAFIGTITGRASIGSLIVIIIVVGGLLLFSRFYGGMPGADHFTRASNFHKRAEKAHTKSEYTKSEKLYKKAQILREEGEKIIFRKG
ncbi:MAG: right-handed parallel beta-helix repeat-containing protein, partial [Nanoarchaeota archaeon]|nr:right-handed parallel beta-helix repeat-containing protein [Nanoarchaeota archaeon]